ncbi:MAG: sodium-dependent transporter [Actinomycetota bacterium]|nr:sodium-dependent transporter [Actinomycetota bacterium]
MTTSHPTDDAEGWKTRSGFMLATIGSAIGVGSIWKFPYEVGANGGGAFVLVYVVGIAIVVVPLMLAEFAIGHRGQADAATSVETVAAVESASRKWGLFGFLGAATSFLILSFYAVVGGWTLTYAVETLFSGLPSNSASVTGRFDALLAFPGRMAFFQALFLCAVALVVVRGVQRGIESSMKILMPLMMLMLLALAVYSMRNGDAVETMRFLFVPDFDDLTGRGVLDALGLGFFSIGVGLGILLTYAAYSPQFVDLKTVAVTSVAVDTVVSLVAGLAVFPVVFANDLDAASGPGLVFESLPLAFGTMPAGRLVATAFFALLAIAALGSAISMLEAVVAVLDRRLGWSRRRSVSVGATSCFVAGLATVFSFNRWDDVHPLGGIGRYSKATVYDLLDEATSQLLLPLGGLALAVFTGWVLSDRLLGDELGLGRFALAGLRLMLRVVAPVTIVAAAVVSIAG